MSGPQGVSDATGSTVRGAVACSKCVHVGRSCDSWPVIPRSASARARSRAPPRRHRPSTDAAARTAGRVHPRPRTCRGARDRVRFPSTRHQCDRPLARSRHRIRRDRHEVEARRLGAPGVRDEHLGRVLLAGERVAETQAVHRRRDFPAREAGETASSDVVRRVRPLRGMRLRAGGADRRCRGTRGARRRECPVGSRSPARGGS